MKTLYITMLLVWTHYAIAAPQIGDLKIEPVQMSQLPVMTFVSTKASAPAEVPAAAPKVPAVVPKAEPEKFFNAGEVSIDTYGLGHLGNAQRSKDNVKLGAGAGVTYWFTRGFGVGARTESDNSGHSLMDRATGRLTVRAPLWDRVAPYGYVDGTFDFERDRWSAGAGGGLEFRIIRHFGVFGEAGLTVDTEGAGEMRGAAGVRLSF